MEMVREGRIVWPTCPECGCRLFYHKLWGAEYLAHKLKDRGTDARGCKCAMILDWWPVPDKVRGLIGVG